MAIQLSEGAIKAMFLKNQSEPALLQVLSIKEQNGGRFRLCLNDSQFSTPTVLMAPHLNGMILTSELEKHSIVKIDEFTCNDLGSGSTSKKVLLISQMTVVKTASKVGSTIGRPIELNGTETFELSTTPKKSGSLKKNHESNGHKQLKGHQTIASLILGQAGFTIRGRVIYKSSIRTWSNAKGDGKLFYVNIIDETGGIKIMAYNSQCSKYFDFLQIDKLYTFSHTILKKANKEFTTLKNDYEITITHFTQISRCKETSSIPSLQFEYRSINEIACMPEDSFVDLLAVVKSYESLTKITLSSNQKEVSKREILLIDTSGSSIYLTLWGHEAEDFEGVDAPVISAKALRVSAFNGLSLTTVNESLLQLNPDTNESRKLRLWFDNEVAMEQ